MRTQTLLFLALSLAIFAPRTQATQADDTSITIVSNIPGVTPFISQVTLSASDTSVIQSVKFTIAARPGSVTRLFSQSYSSSYLASRGYLQAATRQIFLPVYGLYANFTNTVTLTYSFRDGSSKQATTTIATAAFSDPCGISTPTKITPRTSAKTLSYDYVLVRGACGGVAGVSPVIIDTDGAVRWVSPFPIDSILTAGAGFFDHAVYVTRGALLYRVDLDGTITSVADYSDLGVVNFHHEIDPGKTGMVLEADTADFYESINIEVDAAGTVIKTWSFPDIISAVMVAGGDDPDQFVYQDPGDWFHNNSTAYRKSDNTFVVSSREDFVIALDYDSDEVKWILGDSTKKWFQFPSLSQFALTLDDDTLPPIGQHSVNITQDDSLLLMDNGRNSLFLTPPGINRPYSSPRKYSLNLTDQVATEVWNYPWDQTVYSQFCGSAYEDAALNYVLDYAYILAGDGSSTGRIVGLDASGAKIFDYQYPTAVCNTAYNSLPLHAEQLTLSTAGQALNISTRGNVLGGQSNLVGGFIVTGFEPKDIVLRGLGPSLTDSGVTGVLANPVITLYNAAGDIITQNDEWANAAGAAEIEAQGLAPTDAHEAATVQRLSPGTYTVTVSSKDTTGGIGLFEAYDLSRNSNSELANISTRGLVNSGDGTLIGGFIVGDRSDATVVVRALGPSLAEGGISNPLGNPTLSVYDSNGNLVAVNDNWQNGFQADMLRLLQIAPTDDAEAAVLITLAPGTYTAVVAGVGGGTGVALVEVYSLP